MKIGKQNIYGGHQQFADSIFNSSNGVLTNDDAPLLKLVNDKSINDAQKSELIQALMILKDDNKGGSEKEVPKTLWKKFLETSLGTLAEESAKGLVSPTFWTMLFS